MKVSKIALGAALAFGGIATAATAPAAAQQAAPAAARKYDLTKAERAAIVPLQTAITAKDYATAAGALPAAQAAAQSADARYIVATLQLQIAIGTSNTQAQAAAIDALIASGGVPQADLALLYKNQGALAQNANDRQRAEAAWTKWAELAPNDANAMLALAENKAALNKPAEAVQLFDRAIDIQKAAGQPIPDSWYKRGLKFAYEGKMVPQSVKFSQGLLQAYPTKENWRDSLLIYRDLNRTDAATNLDILRLMRAAKALSGERDFYELADSLNNGGLPGESKAVLDEGIALRMVDRNKAAFKDLLANASGKVAEDKGSLAGLEAKAKAAASGTQALSLADANYGYGNHAKAAELYRVALQKGGVDAGVVNTRLGAALALAGQKAEAQAAFQAVTGPRASLASYWMIWLNQSG